MRIVLTGITGFVGQELMPMLQKECKEHEFLTLNIDVKDAKEKYPYSDYANFKHVHTTELSSVVDFNPDMVLHLATVTTSRNDTDIIHPMISANIEFGVLLLDALSKCKNMKLFVNTGSFAEFRYGEGKYDNAYLYSASKTAFRAFLDYYSSLCGYKYINAIPYTVYGGKMTVKRLLDYIYESLDAPEPVNMTGGEQVLDFVHVIDVASFFVQSIVNFERFIKLNNGENIHLGTGFGHSIREVASIIESRTGKKANINWGALPYRERDIMYAVAPVGKNVATIGWRSKVDIIKGIIEFIK